LISVSQAEEILNKKSGWKALTGTTDFGKIVARATSSSTSSSASSSSLLHEDSDSFTEKCRLAFDVFVDRVLGYVGAYFVALDGQVDALVFAGGIGEKSAMLRARVVDKARCLGFDIDAAKNEDPKPGQGAATSGTGGSGSAGQSPVSASVNAIADISKDSHPRQGSREKRTLICWTDEQVNFLFFFFSFS
jgi:acetate kinase